MTRRTLYDETWGKGARRCGGCTLCCKLLPVLELEKAAGARCRHQRGGKGCAVHDKPQMPRACQQWNCRWIAKQDTADLRRPDRVHYVIDIMPDHIVMENKETGARSPMEVVQVWVDPDYPDAHRDSELRAFLERRAAEGIAAIVRYNSEEAFTLFAPTLADDGKWHEVASRRDGDRRSDLLETLSTLGWSAIAYEKSPVPDGTEQEGGSAVGGTGAGRLP